LSPTGTNAEVLPFNTVVGITTAAGFFEALP
jgi:hypothetical protein